MQHPSLRLIYRQFFPVQVFVHSPTHACSQLPPWHAMLQLSLDAQL
jgi:hypothetical protein